MNQRFEEMNNNSQDRNFNKEFKVSNEFTTVIIRKVVTQNGERLEIETPKLGYKIRLDPLALESLTWQSMDEFSKFLENPLGPIQY